MVRAAETLTSECAGTVDNEGSEGEAVEQAGVRVGLDVERRYDVTVEIGFLVAGQVCIVSSHHAEDGTTGLCEPWTVRGMWRGCE